MKFRFSIRNGWYSLIMLVSIVPLLIILLWAGDRMYLRLLENALDRQSYNNDAIQYHIRNEVGRLITLLENKSDPMAYTMARSWDRSLLRELLGKSMDREAMVHSLLVLDRDGTEVVSQERAGAGIEQYTLEQLISWWGLEDGVESPAVSVPLGGEIYVGPPESTQQGLFFTIAVPVGNRERPDAILLARVDINILWCALEKYTRHEANSYLLDQQGTLLTGSEGTHLTAGERVTGLEIIDAVQAGHEWQQQRVYSGLSGERVYGTATVIDTVNWIVLSEVEQQQLIRPIRDSLINVALMVGGVVLLFVWLGVILANRMIRPVTAICESFEEVGRQNYTPITLQCRLREMHALISGFNRMVGEIDVTQRKIRNSEAKFSGIIQLASNGILSIDGSHRIILFNNAAEQIFGFQAHEVLGQPLEMLLPEYACACHADHILEFDRSQESARIKERGKAITGRRKNGEEFPMEVSISRLDLEEGRVYTAVFTDISERIRVEERLQQAAVVFNSTAEGVMVTNSRHEIVAVNAAFTEITGYGEEEVLGRNPSLLQSGRHDDMFYEGIWRSISETGQWQGEMWDRRKNGDVYPELLTINTVRNDRGEVTHHVGVFTDISSIKQSEAELEYLAHHDPLTRLPNRLLLNAHLGHALKRAQRDRKLVAVFFLDLDRFKNINDSMGHAQGDRLLMAVASCLTESFRKEDTISRLGGDEFVIVAEDIKTAREAAWMAGNILKLFSRPFVLDSREMFINASIGISLYPDDGEDVDTLIKNADAAMYRAKEQGRNNYQFYTQELTEAAFDRVSLETSLRHALERREFVLYYQPQFSLQSGELVGVEALIRWQHPDQGLILPGKFIALAEETGLIVPIGAWVLYAACTQGRAWMDAGYAPVRMAVNLSARQFHKQDLAKTLAITLEETRMPAQYLELELTESIVMQDAEATINTMRQLSDMGVELSIDDFGTGYSSLSYMKRFPINKLKIDQSFVKDLCEDPQDAEIILSIIALGHSMNLRVIAEGVETEQQLHYLRQQRCDEVQGYLCGVPVPAAEFVQFLRKES